ncbi:MAG: zinc ribbon domain-containing protein [Methanobrevibacter sp.]|uniref:zinc ribbon domain-containing protein n=1 Tax=Methanobrevibacter sp. TaxID=66852 RepID=UPI0025D5D0BE|nr:zinc ribbon domain-containing protein [Methanobrevibacter sp.]MBQ8017098.1 zinc ribbon domain-containing protein [Methanobrevibacter sp.]
MVKCPRCGYENSSSAVYCDNCAYLLADDDGKKINMVRRESSWNMGIAKKIVIVLGIVIVMFLLFSFVYNNTQPTEQESLNVITDDGSHLQTSSYPYKVKIQYSGSWYAEMGDPNYLIKEADYGSKTYTLDCAAWERVSLDVQKQDWGEEELSVQLIRNGEVVAENSTTDANGRIVIHYNY